MTRRLVVAFFMALPAAAAAQVYKCDGPKGALYQEQPCGGGKKITPDDDPAKTPELRENAVQVLLMSQSKACADFSRILHGSSALAKRPGPRPAEDQAAIDMFQRECPGRGFKLPVSAAIHEQNLALHERQKARLTKLIHDSLPARAR